MTRGEVVNQAVEILGDVNLKSKANKWLDSILLEIESMAFWRWLTILNNHTTGASEASVTFAALNTPINNYAKGISIWNTVTKKTLIMLSKPGYDDINDGTADDITHFSLFNDTIYFFPKTDSADPIEITYYKELTLPTDDTTELSTTPGIPKRYHKYLIDGVIAEGSRYTDDTRADRARVQFNYGIRLMVIDNNDYYTIREQSEDKSALDRVGQLLTGQQR